MHSQFSTIWLMTILLGCGRMAYAQVQSEWVRAISIENDSNFAGYEMLHVDSAQLFTMAEHWHNIRKVPQATLKLLEYLHQKGNVRILAIEQGPSAAYMINDYLSTGDTTMLRHIIRNTMFWGKEHWEFFESLRAFNASLPEHDQIIVRSIDIEYKMEPAVYWINRLINHRAIPDSLNSSVGQFYRLFEDTRAHREKFQGIAVLFYYDKERITQLVAHTLEELYLDQKKFELFFGNQFEIFQEMVLSMRDGLLFDYTNSLTNYRFRDRLIFQQFLRLAEEFPDKGMLCVIGLKHANRTSSIEKLNTLNDSPYFGKVKKIRISALYNGGFLSGDLRRINYNFPRQLKVDDATLIDHTSGEHILKSRKGFDYTLFINDESTLTPYEKIFRRND